MAKVRIVYEVDDKQVDELNKKIVELRKDAKLVSKEGVDLEPSAKKSKGALTDLKGAVAGLGITAVVGAAIVSFAKLTEEINKSRKQVALLTNETGKALDQITSKVLATSKVFDKDFNEVLRAANAVSKNLGITLPETMDQINDAMSRGLDINGEYLETLSEYSPFMKQAGIDFQTFNALIQKQLTDGVFSDKGIDAIKEAVISIQEMTPATRDALRAVGFNTEQLIRDIESGARTYFDVVQEIGTRLEEVTDPRVRGQVLADVFRGAGEDAGEFALTLNKVTGEYQKLSPEAQRAKETTDALLESTESLNDQLLEFSTNTIGVWTQTQTVLTEFASGTLKLVNDLISGFDDLEKKTNSLTIGFSDLSKAELQAELDALTQKQNELNNELTIAEQKFSQRNALDQWFGVGKKAITDTEKELKNLELEIAVLNDVLKESETEIQTETELTEKNVKAKKLSFEEAQKLEKQLNKEAEARRKNNQALIDENESYANRNRILSEAAEGQFQESGIDKIVQSVDDEIREKARLVDAAEKRGEAINKIEEDRQQERFGIIKAAVDTSIEIFQGFQDLRIQQIGQELNALELARNRELELAEGNATREDQINQRFDAEKRSLLTKQANAEKTKALLSIAVNTAEGIIKAVAASPLTFGLPFSAFVAAIGAAQAGFVLAQPVPQFAKGTLGVQGPGSETSDSILARLSVNEAIIPADVNKDYHQAIKAIYNREISPEILNNFAKNGGSQAVVYDYSKLAEAVMNQPQKSISMDSNGFTQHLIKQNKRVRMKESKFKM